MSEMMWRRMWEPEIAGMWPAAAFLLGLFAVAAGRPQSIGNQTTFRLSCICLAVAILVPTVAEVVFRADMAEPYQRTPSREALATAFVVHAIVNLIAKTMFTLGVACAFGSLISNRRGAATATPQL